MKWRMFEPGPKATWSWPGRCVLSSDETAYFHWADWPNPLPQHFHWIQFIHNQFPTVVQDGRWQEVKDLDPDLAMDEGL